MLDLDDMEMVPFGGQEGLRKRRIYANPVRDRVFSTGHRMGVPCIANRPDHLFEQGTQDESMPELRVHYVKRSSPRRLNDLPFRIFRLLPYRSTLCQVRF